MCSARYNKFSRLTRANNDEEFDYPYKDMQVITVHSLAVVKLHK